MTESDRALLLELRKLLLQLHKTLIDWQRAEYLYAALKAGGELR